LIAYQFLDAINFAFELHRNQFRKGTDVPYLAHLLSVASIVLEDGGDEELAIASLLHDAVEDHGGLITLEEIKTRYGGRVAEIVLGCTDTLTTPKPTWRDRKETYLRHLKTASPDVVLVSLADKIHNARSILMDLQKHGSVTWKRFKGGREGTLWYYKELVNIFLLRGSPVLANELSRLYGAIELFQ
jgi:(p)ppGpp synthase/HD superfamily hydrolase